jgi:hypothetical protein
MMASVIMSANTRQFKFQGPDQKAQLSTAAHDVRDQRNPYAMALRSVVGETRAYLGSLRGPRMRPWPWLRKLWEAYWRIDVLY